MRLLSSILVFFATILLSATANPDRARAHDMPAAMPVSGFFDYSKSEPELVLRVPLIMLTNVNLPKRGSGYLDLGQLGDGITRAERAVASGFQIWTEGRQLPPVRIASRISLPSERTFDDPGTAAAAIAGPPLPDSRNVFWNQGYFDVHLIYAEQEPGRSYTLRTDLPPGMAERVLISIGIVAPDKPVRTLSLSGTTADIALDPRWYQAGLVFLAKGVEHILIGYDHLLFLICLILPLRNNMPRLLTVVTAFTVGHSATLIPAALGMVPAGAWFLPSVEALIAASIVYMAVENILGAGTRFRWGLAFGFGLIHGFGFASTLSDVMQFAGGHLIASLVFFNVGIEIGQVLVLAVVLPALALLLRTGRLQRYGVILISILAGHEGWHWMTERLGQVELPTSLALAPSGQVFAVVTWVGIGLILVLGARWAILTFHQRNYRGKTASAQANEP